MKYIVIQHTTIFVVSLILGTLGAIQYSAVSQKQTYLFAENNPFREIRSLLQNNQDMKTKITQLEDNLKNLHTKEQITLDAQVKIKQAQQFSGKVSTFNGSVDVLLEGEIKAKTLVEIINAFWNAGAKGLQLNGIDLSYQNAGVDTAGGQILLAGMPLTNPYLFKVFGNIPMLSQVLNPKQGVLQYFKTDQTKITVSVDNS
jgi:uncharacterized protein YlxW (UPF0749 family)